MKTVITGSKGTLGKTLVRHAEAAGYEVLGVDLPEYDITDAQGIKEALKSATPDLVIHGAAYTNVDGAESEPDLAFKVNALGTRNMALAAVEAGAPLIYISTNMVFDGTATEPYSEFDHRNPRGAYATSKYVGELYVEHLMSRFYIVRISWLYGKEGDSFVHKIIRAADARGSLSVVADEIATPTYAEDLAEALFKLAKTDLYGWYHLPNEGECSRFEFAKEIMRLTGREQIPMTPGALADYKRPAYTPPYSTIRNYVGTQAGITMRPWQDALADYLSGVSNPGVPG